MKIADRVGPNRDSDSYHLSSWPGLTCDRATFCLYTYGAAGIVFGSS